MVFRPFTQVRQTICTSVLLRTSIAFSRDFVLLRQSSPSFGYHSIGSNSHPFPIEQVRPPLHPDRRPGSRVRQRGAAFTFIARRMADAMVCHHNTCLCSGLLGPCYKTGVLRPLVAGVASNEMGMHCTTASASVNNQNEPIMLLSTEQRTAPPQKAVGTCPRVRPAACSPRHEAKGGTHTAKGTHKHALPGPKHRGVSG